MEYPLHGWSREEILFIVLENAYCTMGGFEAMQSDIKT